MNQITVTEALRHIESGQPFTFAVVTYDKHRRKGGSIIEGTAQMDIKNKPETPTTDIDLPKGIPAPRPMTDYEAKRHAINEPADHSKNPNHRLHYTRNIRLLADGHPTTDLLKIHPPLLIQFQGKTVVP